MFAFCFDSPNIAENAKIVRGSQVDGGGIRVSLKGVTHLFGCNDPWKHTVIQFLRMEPNRLQSQKCHCVDRRLMGISCKNDLFPARTYQRKHGLDAESASSRTVESTDAVIEFLCISFRFPEDTTAFE